MTLFSLRDRILQVFGFLRFVYRRWSEDHCPMIAGSLTYTSLLALVPTFLVAVSVMSSLPFFEALMTKFKIFLLINLVPEVAGTIITVYLEQFLRTAKGLTSLGLAIVLVIAVWLMLSIDEAFNAIWRVNRARPYWMSILGYVVLLVTGPALIAASVTVTSYAVAASTGLGHGVGQWMLYRVMPTAISTLAFFLLYRIIPHAHVPWPHALIGGGLAGLLFEVAKEIFRIYVEHSPTYNLMYGAFAFVPILLVWIYVVWLVVLFGAELTASAAYWADGRWKKPTTAAMRFSEAVSVTRAVIESGEASVSFAELMQRTRLPADELEETIGQMITGAVLKRVGRHYALTSATRQVLARPAGGGRLKAAKGGKARNARSSR